MMSLLVNGFNPPDTIIVDPPNEYTNYITVKFDEALRFTLTREEAERLAGLFVDAARAIRAIGEPSEYAPVAVGEDLAFEGPSR